MQWQDLLFPHFTPSPPSRPLVFLIRGRQSRAFTEKKLDGGLTCSRPLWRGWKDEKSVAESQMGAVWFTNQMTRA